MVKPVQIQQKIVVFVQVGFGICRYFHNVECLVDIGIFKQFVVNFFSLLVDFRQKPEPQILDCPATFVGRLKSFEFYKNQGQIRSYVGSIIPVGKVKLLHIAALVLIFKGFAVYKSESVNVSQFFERVAFFQLMRVCCSGVEQCPLEKLFVPYHLHFHDEISPVVVLAPYIHNREFLFWTVGYIFISQIFHCINLHIFRQRQQSIEKAFYEVGMLAKYLLEYQVNLRIQICRHNYKSVNCFHLQI